MAYVDKKELYKLFEESNGIIKLHVSDVDMLSTVDVVEVVRCKDCVYWQDNNDGYPHKECRWGKDETPDAYDFCSYGERRTDDESKCR